MKYPERLFDVIDFQLKNFPKQDMFSAKVNGVWEKHSTESVQKITTAFAAGLVKMGVSPNDFTDEGIDKIGIISNNRPEWMFTDLAVQQTGAVLVPIYPTTSEPEIQFILNDALVKYLFVANADLLAKIKRVAPYVPSLKGIYTFDKIEGEQHWTEVGKQADELSHQQLAQIKQHITKQHLATIIYTSGTTGTPKGVMLTHHNISANVINSKASFPFEDAPQHKVLSFLPLNHIFEKTATYIYLFSGISIYYAESMETIGDNIREVQPNGFSTVPRLLEKVFEKIMAKGQELTGIKRNLFFWAVKLAERYDNRVSGGVFYNIQLALANKLIFSKWREALGGNVRFIITGGAACQERLLRIFNAAEIPVYEGYGPTENSPVICVNRKEEGGQKFGTVGPPIQGVYLKFAEDGEILVSGESVMKGYYKRPDLTAETVIDGWLHTGDIGVLENDYFVKITDRKKELLKTSGGKYVAPQPIENKLKESLLVEQAMIIGNDEKFVAALIVPSFTSLATWMKLHDLTFTTPQEAIANPRVIAKFQEIIDSYNPQFNHVEQVKKFALLPTEWSVDGGEMTPKLSVKRKVVMEKYKQYVENIYNK